MKYNDIEFSTYFKNYPDSNGFFGKYGGSYIPPELQTAMNEISEAYQTICKSRKFIAELRRIRKEFQGRPTPISHLARLSDKIGTGVQLYVKREDLNHTGAHKLNHCMGEVLLAKYMGKKKVIAETGAGQHGVALATAAAYFGLECDIYMGSVDIKKQAPNVARMKILGANVVEVTHGLKTLKEAEISLEEIKNLNLKVNVNLQISGDKFLLEITHQDVSKLTGVSYVASKNKIGLDRVVAFGDGHNDVELIKNVGVGVALENAVDELKKVAKELTDDCNHKGVEKFLKKQFMG